MDEQGRLADAWYAAHACQHAHCPEGCDKPQPFLAKDGRMLCGRCAVQRKVAVEMIPCTPEVCD